MEDPTPEGLLEAWDGMKGESLPALHPAIRLDACPGKRLIHAYQPVRWDGEQWVPQGDPIDAAEAGLAES